MTELSIADLAKAIHEPTSSVRQQVRDKGKVGGIPVSQVDDNGIIKVRVSDRHASRFNLGNPKPDQPASEPEPIEKPEPKPVPVETKQAATEKIYQSGNEPKPAPEPEPKPRPAQTRENPSSGGDVFFLGLCAVAALSFEPVRREARDYFMHHDDWTRRF